MYASGWDIQARLSIDLKTWPRFHPASLSLSMTSSFKWRRTSRL